jgi:hypothetical protein
MLRPVAFAPQSCHHHVEQLPHLIVVLVDFQNLHVFLSYSFVLYFFLYLYHLYQMHQLRRLFAVAARRLFHQMVKQQEQNLVCDKEMNQLLDVNLVHQLALDYFAQDVRQNLDEQSQDEHLTLVDVVLVVIFQEFFLVHLDELVLQVDVVRHRLN